MGDRPPRLADILGRPLGRQRPPHRVPANTQPPGNRPNRHPLTAMQPADLRPLLHVQHTLSTVEVGPFSRVATGSVSGVAVNPGGPVLRGQSRAGRSQTCTRHGRSTWCRDRLATAGKRDLAQQLPCLSIPWLSICPARIGGCQTELGEDAADGCAGRPRYTDFAAPLRGIQINRTGENVVPHHLTVGRRSSR
jgi:hypothetical protein